MAPAGAGAGGVGARPVLRRRAVRRSHRRGGRGDRPGGRRRGRPAGRRSTPSTTSPTCRRCGSAAAASAPTRPTAGSAAARPSTSWSSTRRVRAPGRRCAASSPAWRRGRSRYVACDPAALARDTAALAEAGYTLRELRAYDLFPMTAHVECVALFDSLGWSRTVVGCCEGGGRWRACRPVARCRPGWPDAGAAAADPRVGAQRRRAGCSTSARRTTAPTRCCASTRWCSPGWPASTAWPASRRHDGAGDRTGRPGRLGAARGGRGDDRRVRARRRPAEPGGHGRRPRRGRAAGRALGAPALADHASAFR